MNRILITVCLVISTLGSYAQRDDNDYVITYTNDTIRGRVRHIFADHVVQIIDSASTTTIKSYKVNDLKAIFLEKEEIYEPIRISKAGDRIFARQVVAGDLNMYYTAGEYYIGKRSDSAYVVPKEGNIHGYAKYYLHGCTRYANWTDNDFKKNYFVNFQSIKQLVRDYNNCDSSRANVVKMKTELMFGFGIFGSGNVVLLKKITPAIGTNMDFFYGNFGVMLSTIYTQVQYYNDQDEYVNSSIFEISVFLKYSPRIKRFKPQIFAGPGYIHGPAAFGIEGISLNAGIGLKYRIIEKFYINFEVRATRASSPFSNINPYNGINFILGLSFN